MANVEEPELPTWWTRQRPALCVVLWCVAAALAVRQAAHVLRLPVGMRLVDLDIWTGPSGLLRLHESLYDTGLFTSTPLTGLLLRPLPRATEEGLGAAWTVLTLALVVAVGVLVARGMPAPLPRWQTRMGAPVVVGLLLVSLPVRDTLTLGQLSLLPVLLVLLGCLCGIPERSAGVLVGLATAVQPPVGVFALFLWFSWRRRAALASVVSFVVCTGVAWVAQPDDSATYWLQHLAGAGLGGPADSPANQSLHGLLLRMGLRGPVELVVLALLVVAVVWVTLRRATRYAQDGQVLLGVALTGCALLLVSPVTGQHEQLWLLLTAAGRVGRRKTDRWVWPLFVLLLLTFGSSALVPESRAVPSLVADSAPTLACLLAACVVPFLLRSSPGWDRPEPTPVAPGRQLGGRWTGVSFSWRRPINRPNLLLELLLMRIGYWAYSWIRNTVPVDVREVAEKHGHQVLALERAIGVNIEHWFNHAVVSVPWMEAVLNFSYGAFHFFVTLVLLGWLYVRRPAIYRAARTVLAVATVLALVGFWLFPLAPPRLMPGLGFFDTRNGPQDLHSPSFGALTEVSNQYAAMPSLHIAWSLWCGLVLAALAPWLWLRFVGLLYPAFVVVVIIGTANHYVLDVAGGITVVGCGIVARYLVSGESLLTSGTGAMEPTRTSRKEASGATGPGSSAPDPSGEADPPGEAEANVHRVG